MNILNISQISNNFPLIMGKFSGGADLGLSLFGTDLLIDILYILTIFFGISVLMQKNPVVSIIYFMLIYVSTSLYLYYNGYYGMPLLLILIYVGAIAILFLFILTLINVKEQESYAMDGYNNNNIIIIINLLIFILLSYNINNHSFAVGAQLYNILDNIILLNISNNIINNNLFNLYFNIPINWADSLSSTSEIIIIGQSMYTTYAILLLILGIILVLSIIAAISILSYRDKNNIIT